MIFEKKITQLIKKSKEKDNIKLIKKTKESFIKAMNDDFKEKILQLRVAMWEKIDTVLKETEEKILALSKIKDEFLSTGKISKKVKK